MTGNVLFMLYAPTPGLLSRLDSSRLRFVFLWFISEKLLSLICVYDAEPAVSTRALTLTLTDSVVCDMRNSNDHFLDSESTFTNVNSASEL